MTQQLPASMESAESHLEFEALISDLSSRFVNLPPNEVDQQIQDALRRVCELLDIDLSALWQWSAAAPHRVTLSHLYCAPKDLQAPPQLNAEHFPWVRHQVAQGRSVVCASLAELPSEAAHDRESARRFGIKSNLTLPLSVGGAPPVGALGFNTMRATRNWPASLVNRLRLVTQVFANALARRQLELALHQREELINLAADSAEAGLWVLNFGTRLLWMSATGRAIFGYSPDEVIDTARLRKSVHPDDFDLVMRSIDRSLLENTSFSVEYRILSGSGHTRWIASSGRPHLGPTGQPEHLTGVSIDITERKRTENDLRDLSQRLIRAHEEERALLARELHDDVTQRLAVLAIDVGRAEHAVRGGAQADAMRVVREGLTRLSEDIHSLAYQLHPSVLEELGLAEALQSECERVSRQWEIELSVDLGPLPACLGKDAALCLFRVAQEALNNVTRHAGAHAASLVLRSAHDGLLLSVRDDGVGFNPANPGNGRSLGLASMRERMRLVKGTLDIQSVPGQGTEILAWVPIEGVS